MTFEAIETSKLASPVEFIELRNGGTVWRYTNSNQIEQIGASVYTPVAYQRSTPTFSSDTSDGRMTLTIPNELPVVALYGNQPASNVTTVTILRRHRNDLDLGVSVYWQGIVASTGRNQKNRLLFDLRAVQGTSLSVEVPRFDYSALCSWTLFQDRCGINRNEFRHAGAVLSIESPTTFTVDGLRAAAAALDAGVSGSLNAAELDVYWLAGYVETATGEKRSIYEANVGGFPDRIRVLNPFVELAAADVVTVYAGCARTRDICTRKFANELNFFGFPDIPSVNIFDTELPPGSAPPDRKKFYGN